MKAYKVFNSDWTCLGFKYEIGKSYKIDGELKICENGFHACKQLIDCFNYYSFNPENKVAEVELNGKIQETDDKIVGEQINIIKELSWHEVLDIVNVGSNNTGYRNSGDRNSGDRNSGKCNSGDHNSGDRNSGNRNSGNRNSGVSNSGDNNSGNWNTGDNNSGNWNTGDNNSGYLNTGNWNSCDFETGFFNSTQSRYIRVFNKKCLKSTWSKADKPSFIYLLQLGNNDDTYKEAWQKVWDSATEKDKQLLYALPNFNWKVFTEITGIEEE